MPNKLKDIFSDKMFDLGCNVRFQDSESYKKFLEALKIVENEGREVEVAGISSLTTKARDGELEYPFVEQSGFDKVILAPSTEEVPFTLVTENGEKTVLFKRYSTTKEIIIETDKNDIVYFKMAFPKDNVDSTFQFTYRTQPQFAKTVRDVLENYSTAITLLDTLFQSTGVQDENDESALIYNAKKLFLESKQFFEKLYLIEQELQTSFNLADTNNMESREEDVEELYLLLVKKKVIRLNAKLTATEATGIKMVSEKRTLEIGSQLSVTFVSDSEYTLYGEKISIFTANLLCNAVVKAVVEENDGTMKFLYDDTDSRPMYISYTGFKTIDEAKQERETIMEHKEKYIGALTSNEYMV